MTGKALNAESHDQSSPLGIYRGLRVLSTGIPQARTAESYPGPPRSPAVPTLPAVGSACCVPRGGHASLGSGVRADTQYQSQQRLSLQRRGRQPAAGRGPAHSALRVSEALPPCAGQRLQVRRGAGSPKAARDMRATRGEVLRGPQAQNRHYSHHLFPGGNAQLQNPRVPHLWHLD